MTRIALPHDALIFVGDGRKALLLRNQGDEKFANLITERVLENIERQDMAEAQGEAHHDNVAHRFAAHAAQQLEEVFRARPAKAVVVAAPARTLADLRHALHGDLRDRILAEIDKDLTKMPVWEIERHLTH